MPPLPDRTLGAPWMHLLRATLVDAAWTPNRPWRAAPDAAIQVRGAVGWGFTQAACARPPRACEGCALTPTCLVPTWYEANLQGGHRGRPFSTTVSPPEVVSPDSPLRARLVLYGDLPDRAALLSALRLAGAMLGPADVQHTLTRLVVRGEGGPADVVGGAGPAAWPEAATLDALIDVPRAPQGAVVTLRAPLQADTPRGAQELSPEAFLERCIRRVQALATDQGIHLPARWPRAEGSFGRWQDRRWVDKSQWSQRTGERIDLSGWRGSLEYGPEVAPYADVLAAAALVSVGRLTSYGLGAVSVAWL